MSRRSSNKEKGNYRKPKADLYTVLLLLALLALIVACILMYVEVGDYGDNPWSGAPSVQAVPSEYRQTLDEQQLAGTTFGMPQACGEFSRMV